MHRIAEISCAFNILYKLNDQQSVQGCGKKW